MPLTLYYMEQSPPARSVNLIIHSLGLTAEYKTVNLREKEQYAPEFLNLNPLHTVPVINDDGFVLWESRAIMTYLISNYAKDDALYPKDLKKRAVVDQRLHYSNDVFYVIRDIAKGIFSNMTVIPEDKLEKVKETQNNIEKLLEGQKFMAGDSLTVADYSYVTLVDLLEVYSPSGDKHPFTKSWFERCKSTIKGFEVNTRGANQISAYFKEKLGKAKNY